MNINKAIRELYVEKKRLDNVIASLEEMQQTAALVNAAVSEKKRGRKSMDGQARRQVSERMKRYWAERRKPEQPVQQTNA
ncbi:MAG: hypothetical protein JWO48_1454 [Bryobacterales bacterium]|nr:hypothetical protein [Bryobacterales bacterium]